MHSSGELGGAGSGAGGLLTMVAQDHAGMLAPLALVLSLGSMQEASDTVLEGCSQLGGSARCAH